MPWPLCYFIYNTNTYFVFTYNTNTYFVFTYNTNTYFVFTYNTNTYFVFTYNTNIYFVFTYNTNTYFEFTYNTNTYFVFTYLYLRRDLYLRIGRNFWAEKVLCCILGRCATAGGVTLRLPSLGLARKINYNWSVFAALEFRICIYIWTCICICIYIWTCLCICILVRWPSVGLAGSLVYYHYPLLTIPIRHLWI